MLNHQAAIARNFSKAATSYNQAASLQVQVGQQLLELITAPKTVHNWLDLGCGTGTFCSALQQRYPQAQGYGLDLAPAMLQVAHSHTSKVKYICADAAHLPLKTASLDLVFSNFAVQWCPDFHQVTQEVQRTLKPHGLFGFTSVVHGSLLELEHSWQQADALQHINNFRPVDNYKLACQTSGLQLLHFEQRSFVQHWSNPQAAMLHLKQLGATHLHAGRAAGLLAKSTYQRFHAAYEQQRTQKGLPLTWQVVFGVAQKN